MAEAQFGKIQIDRTEEIRNWANRIKEVKENEKDIKIGIVAANNHYGDYGPGTVDIFRQNMDMEKLSFENVDLPKINRQLELESRINLGEREQIKKRKQTTISDFLKLLILIELKLRLCQN